MIINIIINMIINYFNENDDDDDIYNIYGYIR